eukprot:sb/3469495/
MPLFHGLILMNATHTFGQSYYESITGATENILLSIYTTTVLVLGLIGIALIASTMGHNTWRSHRKIILTTFAVVAVYLLSWTPLLYSWITMTDSHKSTLVEIPSTVYKTVVYGFFVSLVANPLIYTYINKHFKEFLEDEIRSSIKSISSIMLGSVIRRGTKVEINSDSLVEVEQDDDEGLIEKGTGMELTRNSIMMNTPLSVSTRKQFGTTALTTTPAPSDAFLKPKQ